MLQQRADPAVPARPFPFLAASGRLEQRAEAAQERRVVCLMVCRCEATASLCKARLSIGASALAAAETSRVADRPPERARRAQSALRERV